MRRVTDISLFTGAIMLVMFLCALGVVSAYFMRFFEKRKKYIPEDKGFHMWVNDEGDVYLLEDVIN